MTIAATLKSVRERNSGKAFFRAPLQPDTETRLQVASIGVVRRTRCVGKLRRDLVEVIVQRLGREGRRQADRPFVAPVAELVFVFELRTEHVAALVQVAVVDGKRGSHRQLQLEPPFADRRVAQRDLEFRADFEAEAEVGHAGAGIDVVAFGIERAVQADIEFEALVAEQPAGRHAAVTETEEVAAIDHDRHRQRARGRAAGRRVVRRYRRADADAELPQGESRVVGLVRQRRQRTIVRRRGRAGGEANQQC